MSQQQKNSHKHSFSLYSMQNEEILCVTCSAKCRKCWHPNHTCPHLPCHLTSHLSGWLITVL